MIRRSTAGSPGHSGWLSHRWHDSYPGHAGLLEFWGLCGIHIKQMSMKEPSSQPSNETRFPHRWAETGSSKRCWMGGQRSAAAGMGPVRQLPRSCAWGRSPAAPQMPQPTACMARGLLRPLLCMLRWETGRIEHEPGMTNPSSGFAAGFNVLRKRSSRSCVSSNSCPASRSHVQVLSSQVLMV